MQQHRATDAPATLHIYPSLSWRKTGYLGSLLLSFQSPTRHSWHGTHQFYCWVGSYHLFTSGKGRTVCPPHGRCQVSFKGRENAIIWESPNETDVAAPPPHPAPAASADSASSIVILGGQHTPPHSGDYDKTELDTSSSIHFRGKTALRKVGLRTRGKESY